MQLLKPIEKDDFSYFFLLFPPAAAAAAAPATLLKPIGKNDCSYLFLLFPGAAAAAGGAAGAGVAGLHNVPLATPKHHATEGRNDLQKHAAPRLDVPSGFCSE